MRFIVLAVSLIAPAQAFALSCMQPSVSFSYATAIESDDTYLLGTGMLDFDRTLLPRTTNGVEKPAEITRIPATVSGMAFTGAGFDQEFEAEVELIVRCLETWCPVVDSEKEHLMFLREGKASYELALNPCGGAAFPEPTPEMLNEVLACYTDGNCSPEPR
jgi:hypothetical protein